MNQEAGFTIAELLTVIVIIVILLTVGTARLGNALSNSRDVERAEDVASIARKLEQDYSEQTANSPTYPAMNTFYTDALTNTGTAANTSADIFRAPDSTSSSLKKATTTDSQTPNGNGSPELNAYYYQALTAENYLCQDSSQTCVRYRLFYRRESDNKVVVIRSMHQQ